MTKIFDPAVQCGEKIRHPTRKAANRHKAALLADNPGVTLNIYRCPHCGYFHIGNSYARKAKQA